MATEKQKYCANKTGFNLQDLDPNAGTNTMGMNRNKYNECMEQPYTGTARASTDNGNLQSFFTPKNVIIGLLAIGVIIGGLKLAKVF